MSIDYLTTEDLFQLVEDLAVGPIRDVGLLDSAAHRPTTQVWGQEADPSLDLKAVALLESIVRYHPLVDGNKRLGWLAVFTFCAINDVALKAPDDPAYDMVIALASGRSGIDEIAAAFERWRDQE